MFERKLKGVLGMILGLGLVAALHGLGARPAVAQVTGATLSGLVTDPQGGPVPGATVSIKLVATGVVREVTSNADGFYSAPNLLPGVYDVSVAAKGFQTLVEKGVTLTVGAQQALNFSLKLGAVTQTVEVKAEAPTVELTSSTISATVDSTTMRELPLNGRDWTSLAALEPGVNAAPNQVSTGFSANKGNRGFGNQLTNSGHRPNENTYRVNGVDINDYSNGAPGGATGLNLGVDAIKEFSVLTSDYNAGYGRTSGAVINAVTKSGANAFHGTGFFFDRDKIFDARNAFDPSEIPSFRRIQFGGSGGTAIVKDKTFIYGAYEGVRQSQPGSQLIEVPSQEARSGMLCPGGNSPCPGATLTSVTVNPKVAPYLALWPCPVACQNATFTDIVTFPTVVPTSAKENYFTTRVDQKFSDKDSLSVSYFFDSGPQSQQDPLGNASHQVFSRRQGATAEETHIFSPAVVNSFRLGLSRVRGDINDPVSGDSVAKDTALAVAPGAIGPPTIRISGITQAFGLGGLNKFLHRWTSGQLYDDAFVTHGTHSIKFGFAGERMLYNVLEQLSPNGRFNKYTLKHFLTNTPNKLNALAPGGSNEVGIRETLLAGYIQDDWRFRTNFTVNVGLRYEFTTLPTDAANRIQEITSITNCATPGVPASTSSPCGPVRVSSFIRDNPTTKNFEPRIGFSWDPFKNGKTAVRAGFGIFDVLPLPYVFGLNTAATFPFQVIGNDPKATLGNGIDNNITFIPNVVRNRFVQQDPKRAHVENWNFNIQREIAPSWTVLVAYVGSRAVHLSAAADDINLVQPQFFPGIGLVVPQNSPNPISYQLIPNWGGANGVGTTTPGGPTGPGIRPVLFNGESTYHGFQTQLRKNMSHGFQGQASYTFGKCRDTSSDPVTGDTFVNSIAVPILLFKQYTVGVCDYDIRHSFVATFIWDLPGPRSGLASYALGGWELGAIVTATSGSPFTPTVGADGDPLNTGFNGDFSMDFASLVPGCNPIHGGVNYLNTNCFTLPFAPTSFATAINPATGLPNCAAFPNVPAGLTPPAGTQFCQNLVGNAGRNSLYGPGRSTVDFSVFKNFQFTERFKLQFRAEFFNILNRTNFEAPNFLKDSNNSLFGPEGSSIGNAGVLGSTATTSRQIQFGAKIIW